METFVSARLTMKQKVNVYMGSISIFCFLPDRMKWQLERCVGFSLKCICLIKV